MAFVLKRRDAVWKADPTYLPFDLLSTIATIELYLKEHWIEPVHPLEKCYFLALHQTLSVLRSLGALSVQSLARHILTLSPFRAITIDAYRTLLHGMLDEKLLETMEDGTINLGERGEELVSFYDFYSVFLVMPEMTIKFQDKVLGTVGRDLRKGDRIVLSGYKWKITEIDYDRMIAFVVSDGKGGYAKWEGNGSLQVDDRILVKIKEILDSDESYPYLDPCAVDYLGKARERYRSLGIGNDVVVRIERDMVRIYPWLGSRSLACLSACFKSRGIDAIMEDDFCLAVEGRGALTEQAVRTALEAIRYAPVDLMELDVDEQAMRGNFKYDTLLPMELRKEAYVTWAYDPAGMKKGLGRLMEKQRCQSNMMTKSTEQGRLGKKTSGQRNRNQSDD
jgi:ATP-dependent Lhr-like helicase